MCPQNVSEPQPGNRSIPLIDIGRLRDGSDLMGVAQAFGTVDSLSHPTTCGDYLAWRFGKSFSYRGKQLATDCVRA